MENFNSNGSSTPPFIGQNISDPNNSLNPLNIPPQQTHPIKQKNKHIVFFLIIILLLIAIAGLYIKFNSSLVQIDQDTKPEVNPFTGEEVGATPPPEPVPTNTVSTNPVPTNPNEVVVKLSDTTPGSRFYIDCPGGVVCDENFDYRAYRYEDSKYIIGLYFKPNIVNNYSLESFRNYFNSANVFIYFPEKSSATAEARFQTRQPIEEVEFISYINGKLKGVVEVPVGTIEIVKKATECHMADAPRPEHCVINDPYNKTIRFEFEFTVPE